MRPHHDQTADIQRRVAPGASADNHAQNHDGGSTVAAALRILFVSTPGFRGVRERAEGGLWCG